MPIGLVSQIKINKLPALARDYVLKAVDHVRTLLLAPRLHAVELLVISAIVLVGLLLGFFLITNFFHFTERFWRWLGRARYWRPRLPDRADLPIFSLYLGAVAIGGLFLLSAAFPLASNSEFCGRACHSQEPEYRTWKKSSHANVTCYACHINPSYSELFAEKIFGGIGGIKAEASGHYEKPINKESRYSQEKVLNERCFRCHSPDNRAFTVTKGLNMNHPAHLDAGLHCTTCHNRIAHSGAEKLQPLKKWTGGKFRYPDYMTMAEGCWRCHQKGRTFVDWNGKELKAPFRAANGAEAPTSCPTCHTAEWTKLPASHERAGLAYWRKGKIHGETARKDFNYCLGCHESKTFCTKCHQGISMPHANTWYANHGPAAKTNREDCRLCHEIEELQICGNCHHDRLVEEYKFDKKEKVPWRAGFLRHGVVAKQERWVCQNCHTAQWCLDGCHQGVEVPHNPKTWKQAHKTVVPPKSERSYGWEPPADLVCSMCHNKDGNNPNYCFTCHHWKFRGWGVAANPLALMNAAERNLGITVNLEGNTEPCAQHHDIKTFCADCHTPLYR